MLRARLLGTDVVEALLGQAIASEVKIEHSVSGRVRW